MKFYHGFFMLVLLLVVAIPALAAEGTIGGDQGWYNIHCNVLGAKVYLDDTYVGTTEQGSFTVPALTTGTPYKVIRVQKYGYSTFTDSITRVPEKGMTVDLYATLNPLPSATETAVGGDVGWYLVHCNVNGATVLFDSTNRGEISQGILYVPMYSTGTPSKTFTLQKEGYTPYTGNIPQVPDKGKTIDLYGTLNPVPTATATATIPQQPEGGDIGYYKVHCNVDGAMVSFNNEEKGKIANGTLIVMAYTTGTPYKTFTVYKPGYVAYTGAVEKTPKKGEVIDLYAMLTLQVQDSSGTPTPAQKSPLPGEVCITAIVSIIAYLSVRSKN
jgi:hypothetical protein